ncbi:MAG TPA: hypothetical protein VI365_23170 [Trebonia sp.]
MVADEKQPLYRARVVSDVPRWEPLNILTLRTGDVMRLWMIGGQSQGIELISGITDDLSEVARAAGLGKAARPSMTLNDNCRSSSFTDWRSLQKKGQPG